MDLTKMGEELTRLSALVEGWNASGHISEIERDLALAKLCALYEGLRFGERKTAVSEAAEPVTEIVTLDVDLGEVLSMESAAEPQDLSSSAQQSEFMPAAEEVSAAAEPESAVVPEPVSVQEPVFAPIASAPVESPSTLNPLSISEPEKQPLSEPVAAVDSQPVVASLFGPEEEEVLRHRHKQRVIMSLYDTAESASSVELAEKPRPESNAATMAEPVETVMPRAAKPDPETQPFEAPTPVEMPSNPQSEDEEIFTIEEITITPGTVLGEVINKDMQTLADTLPPASEPAVEMFRHEPLDDLRAAIGINDRFLLIRDLFDGDSDACDEALTRLNGFDNLDDCMIHIAENYAWNSNSDGAKLLTGLLERKFA